MSGCDFFDVWSYVGRQTSTSSSINWRVSLFFFLHLIVARVENASSHKYGVENCNQTVCVFLEIEKYSLIEIQKVSRDNSMYFIINSRSVDTAVSSSSINVKLNSVIFSAKGFLIQSYCAVLSDGK